MTENISASAQAIVDSLDDLAEKLNYGCGLSYWLYIAKVSTLIDAQVAGLSPT